METDIPASWTQLPFAELRGVLLIVGASDTGKSTLGRYLYESLRGMGCCVAYLDGDPGQSTLGPPATITLGLASGDETAFPPQGRVWQRFIGSVSPRGHMLPLLSGARRLIDAARDAGAEVIIYDTTGLVDSAQGGVTLKLAKVDLLCPSTVIAIQRGQELEPLLSPLRRSHRVRLIELQPSPAVRPRDLATRQAHRAAQFARYFAAAHSKVVNWEEVAVFPAPDFVFGQLVALEDADGFTMGLGIVRQADFRSRQVVLHTPLASLRGVDAVRLGDLVIDQSTYRDRRLISYQTGGLS